MRRFPAAPALGVLALGLIILAAGVVPAQRNTAKPAPVPHNQDRMPGPALSPTEALAKMQVPPGFQVELVASEPALVNPVAMCFDERGRVWVTESFEYPRQSAGPGRDRIKILEDRDGDGTFETVKIFAEGLNIPSGIAVGHGGVWVANAPDLLFYRIGPDDRPVGKPEVIVTGFGRTDTHELPNSFVWGPDGWLYGLNGVFNHSHVRHRGKEFVFTCALFRVHPRTREFQLFCEGTSNPWGLTLNENGSFFISACVIDHLWHLVESGYYHRQGGPYPPFTWKIGSIVRHKHQKAAYCGLVWLDSDAYPAEFREKLYMGNIHGGCINSDELTRDGSTYFGKLRPDFLTAHDQWFMPVAQKVGPDGCLYVLDWYDRYHCYQDANRDPAGIDRGHGRLYRVRYKDTPRAPRFDLAKESSDQLLRRLHSPNIYFRETAQRVLAERSTPEIRAALEKLALDDTHARKARLHATWALVSSEAPAPAFLDKLLSHPDATFRAWGVRAAGNLGGKTPEALRERIVGLARDPSPDVRLQVAIAATKLPGIEPIALLIEVLTQSGTDKLIPHIVWQNLHPLLGKQAGTLIALLHRRESTPHLGLILPRLVERILAAEKPEPATLVDLYGLVRRGKSADLNAARQMLSVLTTKIETGEIAAAQLPQFRAQLQPLLQAERGDRTSPVTQEALFLASILGDREALAEVHRLFESASRPEGQRLRALEVLIAAREERTLDTVRKVLATPGTSTGFRGELLARLGRLNQDAVADVVLSLFDKLEADQKPRAVELLTQRPAWGKTLFRAIAAGKVNPGLVNINQARRLVEAKDAELSALVLKHYGTIRTERNPAREKVVKEMRQLLESTKGDPVRGIEVYKKLCAQCHKLHGEGAEVGPDITSNGRASFDQLLSNVFDPNLVIGDGYLATSVETTRGRTLTGLLVENSPARVILKVQGGKQEIIARGDIERLQTSKLGLMPEDVEKQLKPQEIADLFSLLILDRPPSDPKSRRIPGTPRGL